MQWVALMFAGFLILGLRRSPLRAGGTVGVVAIVSAALLVWYTQMAPK